MRMVPQPRGWFVRRGTFVQAEFPSSYLDMFASRPLRSTVVTRFFANMGRSDSRSGPLPGLCLPPERWLPPPRRVSQVPRLIYPRVLSPPTPESPVAACAHYFVTGVRLHHTSKIGHFPFALTGPYRVRWHYGPRVRLPGLRQRDYSRPRRVGYLSNEQLQGKLLVQDQPGLSWSTRPALRLLIFLSRLLRMTYGLTLRPEEEPTQVEISSRGDALGNNRQECPQIRFAEYPFARVRVGLRKSLARSGEVIGRKGCRSVARRAIRISTRP
jgi:hypothetical protein